MYEVTKTFTGGTLKGLTIVERTPVCFAVGQIVDKPCGGSPYRVDAVNIYVSPEERARIAAECNRPVPYGC